MPAVAGLQITADNGIRVWLTNGKEWTQAPSDIMAIIATVQAQTPAQARAPGMSDAALSSAVCSTLVDRIHAALAPGLLNPANCSLVMDSATGKVSALTLG